MPTLTSRHQPSIAVVLLYFRYGAEVFRTLDALEAQTLRPSSVVLVDNASEDGVIDETDPRLTRVFVAASATNRGYGGGMNFGLGFASASDAVLLLTHDCILTPTALEQMSAELSKADDVGVVGPLLGNRADGAKVFSAGGYFYPRSGDVAHRGSGEGMEVWKRRGARDVDWIDGSCQLIRRQVLKDVGPLDEDYFAYWEEVAYHTRARIRGWRVVCTSRAIAWQDPGNFSIYYAVRNQLRYASRFESRKLFARHLARAGYRGVTFGGERKERLTALWDFLTGYCGPAR